MGEVGGEGGEEAERHFWGLGVVGLWLMDGWESGRGAWWVGVIWVEGEGRGGVGG